MHSQLERDKLLTASAVSG